MDDSNRLRLTRSISPILSQLSFLSAKNNLKGFIPSEIRKFDSLDVLGLEFNKLSGTIPSQFNASLMRLRLNSNKLEGTVPSTLPSTLQALYLNDNKLSGSIENFVDDLQNLRQLLLNDNDFEGDIPDSLAELSFLRIARFEDNKLRGAVPDSVCDVKEQSDDYLLYFSVDCQKVECDCCAPVCDGDDASGPTASSPTPGPPTSSPGSTICPGISDDERTEQIFEVLSEVSDRDELDDSDSPQGRSIVWLVVDDERQLCPDDDDLVQRYLLSVFYYSTDGEDWIECSEGSSTCEREGGESWLSDARECDWGGITCNNKGNIQKLELDSNNLGGNLPMEMKEFQDMDIIDLENNDISGSIPEEFNDTLIRLRLNKNRFRGAVSGTLSGRLAALYLSDNRLQGSIDDLIEGSTRLNRIELDNNRFDGEIPESLSQLEELKIARFNGNGFSGSMPDSVCNNPEQSIEILEVDCADVECDCCTPSCPSP